MRECDHWEHVYGTRPVDAVSWYQARAALSLELIRGVAPSADAPIIDVGGGASVLVDGLLDAGFHDLTVVDLAPAALDVARVRLGARARAVRWHAADVLEVPVPDAHYALWHDRAVFHFLTDDASRARYVERVRCAVRPGATCSPPPSPRTGRRGAAGSRWRAMGRTRCTARSERGSSCSRAGARSTVRRAGPYSRSRTASVAGPVKGPSRAEAPAPRRGRSARRAALDRGRDTA